MRKMLFGIAAILCALLFAARADAFESCLANVESSKSLDESVFNHTWMPLPESARTAPADKLRSLLTAIGAFKDQRGSGIRQVFTARLPTAGWEGATVHFGVDEALGVAWVDARRPRDQYDGAKFEYVMCAILETAFPTGEDLVRTGGRGDKGRRKLEASLEARRIADRAWLDANLPSTTHAVVIMPIPDSGGPYGFTNPRKSPDTWTDATSFTHWSRTDGLQMIVGENTGTADFGFAGYRAAFGTGAKRYLVYVVAPGEYRVGAMSAELANRVMPQVQTGPLHGPGAIGTAYLEPAKYSEYYFTKEWQNAKYEAREVVDNYCSMVIVGGPCVQWSQSRTTVQDMTAAPGYYDQIQSRPADMVRLEATIERPVATLVVKAGEVVLVDGLYAQQPAVAFDDARCALERQGVRCDVTEVAFVRVSADINDLTSPRARKASAESPWLRQVLASAVPRALDVSIPGGPLVPGRGQLHLLKAADVKARR